MKIKNKQTILQEAQNIVYESDSKRLQYGEITQTYQKTSEAFRALTGVLIEPEHVGILLVLFKLNRECNSHKRDNLVDACGYLTGIEELYI